MVEEEVWPLWRHRRAVLESEISMYPTVVSQKPVATATRISGPKSRGFDVPVVDVDTSDWWLLE